MSLTLSLSYVLLAILADDWYSHYLPPVPGNPQDHSRNRHFHYKGLIDWPIGTFICVLPLILHLSLFLFFLGLLLYLIL